MALWSTKIPRIHPQNGCLSVESRRIFLGQIIALFNSGSFLSGHIWLMGLCTAPSSNCLLQLPRNYQKLLVGSVWSVLSIVCSCQLHFLQLWESQTFLTWHQEWQTCGQKWALLCGLKMSRYPQNGENPRQVLTRLTIKDVNLAHDLTGGAHHRRWPLKLDLPVRYNSSQSRSCRADLSVEIYIRSTWEASQGASLVSKQPNVLCRSIMCRLKNDEKWVDKFTWV